MSRVDVRTFTLLTLPSFQVLVNGPQTPLATNLKSAEIQPHVPHVPLGKIDSFLLPSE